MAVINDLTFLQWQAQFAPDVITAVAPVVAAPAVAATSTAPATPAILASPGTLSINLTALLGASTDVLTDVGVVKALSLMLEAGYKAQLLVNTAQVVGERLAAFNVPTSGGTVNGFVPTSRSLTSRAEVSTAVNIVGQIA